MSDVSLSDLQPDLTTSTEATPSHRHRAIRVLFVHRDAEVVNNCQQELNKGQFIVSADVVLTLTQCIEHLRSHSYDLVVAEYPCPDSNKSPVVQLLHQTVQEVPVLFTTTVLSTESIAQLSAGGFDYVEQEHLAQLPMAVRRP